MTGFGVSINFPHLISPSCVPFSSPEYVSGLTNYSLVATENQIADANIVHGKA